MENTLTAGGVRQERATFLLHSATYKMVAHPLSAKKIAAASLSEVFQTIIGSLAIGREWGGA